MDNPKVSIIVPIYRVEEYIERCAESLFAQTFDDIEYIFVDDCSPDKSVEILQRTLEKYPHRKRLTRIERLSSNSGHEEKFFSNLTSVLSHFTLKASYSLTADRGPADVTNSQAIITYRKPCAEHFHHSRSHCA